MLIRDYNDQIMKTFIFGAGASIPFFDPQLNTHYLTEKVSDINEWRRVITKFQQINPEATIVSANEVVTVIQQILKIRKQAHFEQIAEIIDKISSLGFDLTPKNNMLNTLLWVMNQNATQQPTYHIGNDWKNIPFLIREIIAEAILELENNHKRADYDQLIGLQRELIRTECLRDNEVSVMSLNYDDIVYESLDGLGFTHGFVQMVQRYGQQMDINTFMHAEKVCYFPHGHLKFLFTDNDNVSFWDDSYQANNERWARISDTAVGSALPLLNGTFAYNFNTFLTTGQTKDDSLNHMPYAICYQRLAVDLFRSDRVYVIGYSFGDEHVNRLLRSFIELNPDNRIFVVDYYPDQITMVDEYHHSGNMILKIHYYLGTNWQVMYTPGEGTSPANPKEVDSLNNRGYGELFDQVIFYKNGYEAFLNEFRNVI